MKKLIVLFAVMVMAFGLLTGCGDSSDETKKESNDTKTEEAAKEENDISGDWVLTTIIDAEGNEYTLEEYCAAQGVDTEGVEATYNFDGDSKVTAAIGGIPTEGTYTFDGETITTTFSGNESKFTYDADSDIICASDENTGMQSIMERQ